MGKEERKAAMKYETPFLCSAYFSCDECQRPIVQYFESSWKPSAEEWAARSFKLQCFACGWEAKSRLGSFAVHNHVYEWTSEVVFLPLKRPA
jgi:hypothetical protein